jgi:LuxR family maltose regulon positive regulatory protein
VYPPVHSASTGSDANRSVAREPDALVVRRELLQRLKDQPAARLIVVQGPAGFGKTVLLRQYCEHRTAQGDAIAWMRMDARSADPPQFLRLLCAAIQGIGENPPRAQGKATARSASLDDFGRVLRRVRGRAVIVVDGFEHAGAAGLESVFAQVVRLLPEGVQLCIGTRALPPANLARLLVEDQAIAIGQEDLRFRAAETAEFLRDVAALSPAEVTDIHQRSDGWPAALQCFRLCMRRGRDYRSMAYSGKGITPELIDFLASDVFEDLTPRMQSLLLELCVPEKINAALVEHITGAPGGRAVLTEIEKAGLFLSHSDLDRTWYRFHNLFRHFLLARLRTATSAEEMQGRHLRIAQWFAAQEWREEALQHYIDAGQLEPAAQLLDAVIDGFVAEERLGLIERYVDQFPLETLLRHENLANAAVIAYGFRRSFDKANRLIEQRQLANDAAAADPHRAGIRNYARLYMLAAQDRIEEMGAVALETAAQLTEQDGCRYGVAFNARAMWLVANHQFDEARGLLLRARPLHDQDGHLFGQAYQEAIYSMVLTQQGRVNDAIKGLSAALRRTEQGATGSVTAGSVIAAYLAEACYEQNRIADAEALVHDYGQLAEQQGIADQLAVMLLTQARMAHLRGDETEAEEILERLLYLGYRHSFRRVVTYARAEFVRQATLSGDLDKAERRLREFDPEHDGTVNERLVFHAGETEARSITLARYLIYTGRHANARNLLQVQMREARLQRRRRREVKLTLLLAISLNAEGRTRLARRTFLEALELARPQEFVRAFLDERQLALRLIKDVRQSMHELADLPVAAERDALVAHLDRLLREAGELAPAAAAAPGALRVAPSPEMAASLTEREKKLLQHVARGLSNKDLATRLSVSTNTIKWHLRNIFEKLQISNRVQAIAVARQLGLID